MKNVFMVFVIFVVTIVVSDVAFAKDLVAAATSAQQMFNRIGFAAVSIGITIGGILLAVGLANIGRMVIFCGLAGAVTIFAAPGILNLLKTVFQ